ncbi:MAG: Fe-S-containing protein [Bacteroidetes bacterium]|nr:Fe-S-containing protein [Bacteroidota bacterium]
MAKYNSSKLFLIGIILTVLSLGIYIFYSTAFRDFHPTIDKQPSLEYPSAHPSSKIYPKIIKALNNNSTISISLEEIRQNTIVKYFYPDSIFKLPIIAYLTPRGKIVTAISISESCTSQDFYLEGNNIYCSNCPSYWNMESLEAYSCCQRYYPDPIESKLIDGEIIISKTELRDWQKRD